MFFSPAFKAILPDIVTSDVKIERVNAVINGISEVVNVSGPVLGAILLPFIGVNGCLLVNSISFFLAMILDATLNVKMSAMDKALSLKSILEDILEGIRYIGKQSDILKIILSCSIFNIFASGISVIEPLFVKNILKAGSYGYSFTIAAESGGAIIGSLIVARFAKKDTVGKKNSIKSLRMYLLLAGIPWFLTIVPNLFIFVIVSATFGFVIAIFNIKFFSYLQTHVTEKLIGRVFSVVFTLASVLMPIGSIIFGFIGKSILGISPLVLGVGIIMCTELSFLGVDFFERSKKYLK
ncbi:MFS transporter [Rummeliibacillus suwonensis]|nr:MFS transporter [Rummeliibacillus suwonensis]